MATALIRTGFYACEGVFVFHPRSFVLILPKRFERKDFLFVLEERGSPKYLEFEGETLNLKEFLTFRMFSGVAFLLKCNEDFLWLMLCPDQELKSSRISAKECAVWSMAETKRNRSLAKMRWEVERPPLDNFIPLMW